MNNNIFITIKMLAAIVLCTIAFFQSLHTQTWTSLNGPNGNASVRDISASAGGIIYATDAIRLAKSTDGGISWLRQFNSPTKSPLVVSANNMDADKVVVAKEDTAWYSEIIDTVLQWHRIYIKGYPLRFARKIDEPEMVYLGTKYKDGFSSLKISDLGGRNLHDDTSFANIKTNVNEIVFNPENTSEVWIAGSKDGAAKDKGVWKKTAGGWIQTMETGSSRNMRALEIFYNVGDTLIIVGGSAEGELLYKVVGGDGIWSEYDLSFPSNTGAINSIKYLGDCLVIAAENGIYRKEDYGQWVKINGEQSLVIEENPDSAGVLFLATGSGISISRNQGQKWGAFIQTSGVPLPILCVAASATHTLAMRQESYVTIISEYNKSDSNWVEIWRSSNVLPKFYGTKVISVPGAPEVFYFIGATVEKPSSYTLSQGFIYKCSKNVNGWVFAEKWRTKKIYYATISNIEMIPGRGEDSYFAEGYFGKHDTDGNNHNIMKSVNGVIYETIVGIGGGKQIPTSLVFYPGDSTMMYSTLKGNQYGYFFDADNTNITTWTKFLPKKIKNAVSLTIHNNPGDDYLYIGTDKNTSQYSIDSTGKLKDYITYLKKNTKQVLTKPYITAHNGNVYLLTYDKVNKKTKSGGDSILIWKPDNNTVIRSPRPQEIKEITQIAFTTSETLSLYAASEKGIYKMDAMALQELESQPGAYFNNDEEENPSLIRADATEYFDEDVTIEAGESFTIESGATLYFAPGVKLTVNGTLYVEGTEERHVRLLADEMDKWEGIVVANGGSIAMSYAEINNARCGLFAAQADVTLEHTRVENCNIGVALFGAGNETQFLAENTLLHNAWGVVCLSGADAVLQHNRIGEGQKGMLIDASSPLLFGNTIDHNEQVGVVIYGGGYPRFGDMAPDKPGLNIVQGNDVTQILAVKGYAFLGYLRRDCVTHLGGDNLISNTDPDAPLCVTVEKSNLVAMRTDWGYGTVTQEDFIYDDNSRIIFECLQQEAATEQERLLWEALEQRGATMYNGAIEKYKAILTNYGMTYQALQALTELHETYTQMIREGNVTLAEELRLYLESLIQLHPNGEIQRAATILLASDYDRWEDAFAAMNTYESALTMELDSDTRISTLLSKLLLELCDLHYPDHAEQTFSALQTQFPTDERTQLAEQILRIITGDERFGGNYKQALKVAMRKFPKKNNSVQSALPAIFALQQNFPNPFNPVTAIKYHLPEDAKVTIKIFDILGREVFTLIDRFEQAGYKQVQLDVSHLASGVYFYKMQAGNFQSIQKLVLLK